LVRDFQVVWKTLKSLMPCVNGNVFTILHYLRNLHMCKERLAVRNKSNLLLKKF
jgi:hypothetical protein